MKANGRYRAHLLSLIGITFIIATFSFAGDLPPGHNFISQFVEHGKLIDVVIVPGRPPVSYRSLPSTVMLSDTSKSLSQVPAFIWSYGCAPTSAAMLFGYYDHNGYPDVYTGPANGGLCPMTNAVWGSGTNGSPGECPLSATHEAFDDRPAKGHVDDYWVEYGSYLPDPYTGLRPEHVQGECTGDYMGSNQYSKQNNDGETTFFFYNDGSPLYDYTGLEPIVRDGCHGLRLFFESRGYGVTSNYSQFIQGFLGLKSGFTFEDYQKEIDAGRPVLLHLADHVLLGYGYSDSGSIVYLHDTWDYSPHQMVWGGEYGPSNARHFGVTVFVPSPADSDPAPDLRANAQDAAITVSPGTPVSVTASLVPGRMEGTYADYWILCMTPWGWYSLTPNGWMPGAIPLATGPVFHLYPVEILNGIFPGGDYHFYFIIDTIPDGIFDQPFYYDGVVIHVTE